MLSLSSLLAVGTLLVGAAVLWIVSELLSGREEVSLHIGNVMLATVVGTILFAFWGWRSTAIVLGAFGLFWIVGGLFERYR